MNVRGRTYVLIGRTTFSAAGNLVTKLANETEAVFVGEPSGSKPNHYGDARRVTLPESRLDVSISTLYWQDGGPFNGAWLAPSVAVDTRSADWVAGRDPVLEASLALDAGEISQPFQQLLTTTFQAEGLEAAMVAYERFKADPAHRYVDTERAMNQAGYFLLGNNMVEPAIQVFHLNVVAYSASWNAHDSLGEALARADRVEEAIESYARSVELNPANQSGVEALERLRAQREAGGGQGRS
ncbi:MAG: hypothetical protein O7A98_04860, partial [Acidobacteria bacterium]|nr:hypothetical protein [Acidobacteriota bacterium]